MECPKCRRERNPEDFLLNNPWCYKCVLKNKKNQHVLDAARQKEERICTICGKELPSNRWKYCSTECFWEGDKEMQRKYWTRNIKDV